MLKQEGAMTDVEALPVEDDETFGLSLWELDRCREMFDSIDRDGNGQIDVREMRYIL